MDNRQRAEQVYSQLKAFMQKQGIAYTDTSFGAAFTINGEEFPIDIRASVNADTQRLDTVSVLPFQVRKDRAADMTRALNYINGILAGGKFVLDIRNDTVAYIYSAGFADVRQIEPAFVEGALSLCFHQTDTYFSGLYALAKGLTTVKAFTTA